MSFKDIVRNDNEVFINCEEFASIHVVNGREMPVIIDNNELNKREKRGFKKATVLLYVRASDYGLMPGKESVIEIDRKKYLVKDTNNESGVYSLTLEANL